MTSPAEYAARYDAGETIEDLAREAKCDASSMRALLVNAGSVIRKRGQQLSTRRRIEAGAGSYR